jgi:hypothetical protein
MTTKRKTFYYKFGHKVNTVLVDGKPVDEWYDNGESTDTPRPCPRCKKYQTKEGHDPCLSNLPGVESACCGHGINQGYIKFTDGTFIRGWFTVEDRIITERPNGKKDLMGFKNRW